MKHHTYKKMEIVGTSPKGTDAAIRNAIERASKTVRNLRWFEVDEIRGSIDDDDVSQWQVTLKIGFTLDDEG